MKKVTIREAQRHLSKLLAELESGEEIVITKRGVDVGKLVPLEARQDPFEREVDWSTWVEEQREWLKSRPLLKFNPVLLERESYNR